MTSTPTRRWRWKTIKRDSIFLLLGLAIIVNESFLRQQAQFELLVVGLALCGLPNILHANDALKRLLTTEETSNKEDST